LSYFIFILDNELTLNISLLHSYNLWLDLENYKIHLEEI